MASAWFAKAQALVDNLGELDVASIAVGWEPAISAADYPLIRILRSETRPGSYGSRTVAVRIVFGVDATKADGVPTAEDRLDELEAAILERVRKAGHVWERTVYDDDRGEQPYRHAAVIARLEG